MVKGCGDGGLHFHVIMKRLSDRNNNNHYHHGGGRSKRNKVKKGGTFFSEITNVLTSHKALSGNVAKNKEYMNRRTCTYCIYIIIFSTVYVHQRYRYRIV